VSNKTPGVYVLLLTDSTWSLCFVTHRLYLEFIFCYSQIVLGVNVLLLTDCTWSICFVTQIVLAAYAFLLLDCTWSLCLVTKHKLQVQSVSNKT
jgi:hypothetical protein